MATAPKDNFGSERWSYNFLWINFAPILKEATAYLKRCIRIRELPIVAIDRPNFAEDLPAIPAVYFICQPPNPRPIYIGRTRNLKARWTRDPGKNAASLESEHHKLKSALRLRNSHLAWVKVPPDYLAIVELLLIQKYKPRWNVVRR